jgi:hypothetical protein
MLEYLFPTTGLRQQVMLQCKARVQTSNHSPYRVQLHTQRKMTWWYTEQSLVRKVCLPFDLLALSTVQHRNYTPHIEMLTTDGDWWELELALDVKVPRFYHYCQRGEYCHQVSLFLEED